MSHGGADDRAFLARAYRQHGAGLYRYALMLLADAADAEDVLQQVFAALADRRGGLAIDDAGAYLRRAVRNAAFSLLRRRRTVRHFAGPLLEPVAPGASPAERLALEQGLRQLPPEQREVVHLHVYEGMTFREIAAATGESVNTVAGRYRYALDHLRRFLCRRAL
ncbi:MAG TPA: sigma-70 family RNA polymerase sigma factor [Vicinamibacterales bacterium]|nr:sigma-70 family RNA polymerase sigma factor [Vicinamibacterales bacterium]